MAKQSKNQKKKNNSSNTYPFNCSARNIVFLVVFFYFLPGNFSTSESTLLSKFILYISLLGGYNFIKGSITTLFNNPELIKSCRKKRKKNTGTLFLNKSMPPAPPENMTWKETLERPDLYGRHVCSRVHTSEHFNCKLIGCNFPICLLLIVPLPSYSCFMLQICNGVKFLH